MTIKRSLAMVLAACAFVVYPTAAQASAVFSVLLPYQVPTGPDTTTPVPGIRLNLATGEVSSADVDLSTVTGDPVYKNSVPLYTVQIPTLPAPYDVPLLSLFHMDAVNPTFIFGDASSIFATYGPGTFSIALPGATSADPVFPWVSAAFTTATLSIDLVKGTGVFFGDATYSGFSFDPASGLTNPGSFVFALDGQQFLPEFNLLQYNINPGALSAEPVPEPATLTLVGLGLAAAAARRRRVSSL